MTEKGKMINGLAYIAADEELQRLHLSAFDAVYKFNQSKPSEKEKRVEIIKSLFGSTGNKFQIESPFYCDYGFNIHIGDYFFANFNLVILDCAKVSIGNNVMFGPNVSIYTAGHPMHHHLRNLQVEWAKPVHIGDNVWLGGNVVVNPGISIGKNTVIGSGSVVTKDIPEQVFAAGNPCKVIRTITESEREFYYKNQVIETDKE